MKNKYVVFLIFLAIVSHWQWFSPYSILSDGDWQYRSIAHLKELDMGWGSWNYFLETGSQFGVPNVALFSYPLRGVGWFLLANIGFGYDAIVKITLLVPIALLGFLSPFFLFRRIFQQDLIACSVALFYGSVTYFLVIQQAHLFLAMVYAVFPFYFYIFIKSLESNQWKHWTFFSIFTATIPFFDPRFLYIISFIFLVYFLKLRSFSLREYFPKIISSALFIFFLSAFWVFPTVFGGMSQNVSDIANRGLFGDNLFDIYNAVALFKSDWTGGRPNTDFTVQPIIWYFWFFPLIAFSAFFLYKYFSTKERNLLGFFSVLAFVGILLTKQSGEPMPGLYLWLYENLPGFNLFREASKFYLLTAFGYSGMIGFTCTGLMRAFPGIKLYSPMVVVVCAIVVFSTWNLKPLITGDMRRLMVSREIPEDYVILNKFIENQPDFFRVLWVPGGSRWGIYTINHPKVHFFEAISSNWSGFPGVRNNPEGYSGALQSILSGYYSESLFDSSSIKYVVVPLKDSKNEDDFFQYFGNERESFVQILDNSKFLKRIDIGLKDVVVYENTDYKPNIFPVDRVFSLNFVDELGYVDDRFRRDEYHGFDFITGKEEDLRGFSFAQYAGMSLDRAHNVINNPSFEDGSWSEEIGDCNNYDAQPVLKMVIDQDNKTDGRGSLQLEAERHIACVSMNVLVKPSTSYSISFDYQNPKGGAGIAVGSSEGALLDNRSLPISADWHQFRGTFKTSQSLDSVNISIYAAPDESQEIASLVRYDNFRLFEAMDVSGSKPRIEGMQKPETVLSEISDPSGKVVKIKAASTHPLFLAMSDTYSPLWHLRVISSKEPSDSRLIDEKDHFVFDSFLNGWYINVEEICSRDSLCKKNSDGTYDISMIVEFSPRRWFLWGSVVSVLSIVVGSWFLWHSWRLRGLRREGKGEKI